MANKNMVDMGLTLSLEEFESLPQKQQLSCLYQNQVKTIQLMINYDKQVERYKVLNKWVFSAGGVLISAVAFLFTLHIK